LRPAYLTILPIPFWTSFHHRMYSELRGSA
jgi:hypothetical protein